MEDRSLHAPGVGQTIAIVVPVMNDWACFACLLRDLCAFEVPLTVFAVDDGSNEPCDMGALVAGLSARVTLEVVRLSCNLGHQRAIAVGLAVVARREEFAVVIVCDADGEDRATDLFELLRVHREAPASVIVAQRKQRSEGVRFSGFYYVYKAVFKLLTGKTIDFGNFCLIPFGLLDRITHMSELWNHLAATVVRSRVALVKVPTARGARYAGRSSMSMVTLVTHGLSAISVFSDLLFVRMLIFCSAVALVACGLSGMALLVKLTTSFAVPNWATIVVGISAVILFQAATLLAVAAFMMLANRSAIPMVPKVHAMDFIAAIDRSSGRGPAQDGDMERLNELRSMS